ncbi:MAG: hypothetical protein WAW80_04710 [Candidatus Saccharimonadales bacterium]
MASRVLHTFNNFPVAEDPVRTISQLQAAIENSQKRNFSDIIEQKVGQVVIHALDLQKDFFYQKKPAAIIDLKAYSQRVNLKQQPTTAGPFQQ